ncbi:MAG: hypothetical protein QM741_18780 [Rudaea sp.]|uniref:hypothetical protein n=1 Tax=Rudaea sp. TaxID=2136325 RepID=UPI0039E3B038
MIRCVLFALVVIVVWLAVLAWSANLPLDSPLVPAQRLSLRGAGFNPQFGHAERDADDLVVDALGADGNGLQTIQVGRARADETPVLCYRMADFPDTLELSLVFRRIDADADADLGTISIPSPGRSRACVNLATLPDWQGEIREIGFAEYATAQLVPRSAAAFRPFRIEAVELQSASWSALPARLRTDWFSYRPWALLSISALGPQIATLRTSWMQSALALGILLALAAAWAILRWPRRRIAAIASIVVATAWILLDLRWLDDFAAKHRLTEELYAGKPWSQRLALQPDEDTFAAAQEVSRFAATQGCKRVLVLSDSSFTLLRLVYFLLPLNAAPLVATDPAMAALPRDTLIVAFDSKWKYDADAGTLGDGRTAIPAKMAYAHGGLRMLLPGGTGQ